MTLLLVLLIKLYVLKKSKSSSKKSDSSAVQSLSSIDDPYFEFHSSNLLIVSSDTVGFTFRKALTKSFGEIGGICHKNLNIKHQI